MLEGELDGAACKTENDVQPTKNPNAAIVLQSLLTTLANFKLDYERERDLLCRRTKDSNLRVLSLRKLARKHQERCEPYVRHIQMLRPEQDEVSVANLHRDGKVLRPL